MYLVDNPGRVITTEVVASLVGKAWPLSLTPVNIMACFKKSGTFPLNPGEVTDRHLAPSKGLYKPKSESPDKSPSATTDCGSLPSTGVSCVASSTTSMSSRRFTTEQQKLYQIRYSEGYDLPDPDYKAWLEIYHPTTPSSSAADSLITHISCGSLEDTKSDASSDPLSEVLKIPRPTARTKRKRKPGLNSKATTLTDDDSTYYSNMSTH